MRIIILGLVTSFLIIGCGGSSDGKSSSENIYGYKDIDIYPNLEKKFAEQLVKSSVQARDQYKLKDVVFFVTKKEVLCTDYQFSESNYEGTTVGGARVYYKFGKNYAVTDSCMEDYGYSSMVGQYGDYTYVSASKNK